MLVHKNKTHRNAGVTQQVSPTASGLPGRPLILRVGRVGAAERGRECNTHTHTHTHSPRCLPACLPALGRARPKMLHLVALGCLFFPGLFLLSRRALHNAEPALTDGDLVCLSVRIVSSVQAMMAVITGVVITSSCNHVMKDSHWISKAYILFGTPYMVYDIYAMYLCHWYKYNGKYNSSFSFVTSFLKKNPLIILHHLVLFLVCFPIILFYRKGLGDFFLGCLLLAEMSTPFVSLAKILRQLKKQDTLLYKINGVVVLVTFFVCRILVFPFMYWAYGRQYGIPAYRVPFHIPWHCTVANGLIMAPQLYWLTQILKKAVKIVKVE